MENSETLWIVSQCLFWVSKDEVTWVLLPADAVFILLSLPHSSQVSIIPSHLIRIALDIKIIFK